MSTSRNRIAVCAALPAVLDRRRDDLRGDDGGRARLDPGALGPGAPGNSSNRCRSAALSRPPLPKLQWGAIRRQSSNDTNMFAAAFLMPTTLGYLIVRLRRPRPSLHQIALQPGMVANEALAAMIYLMFWLEAAQPVTPHLWVQLAILLLMPLSWMVLALAQQGAGEGAGLDRWARRVDRRRLVCGDRDRADLQVEPLVRPEIQRLNARPCRPTHP